jgi:hypothetical protein
MINNLHKKSHYAPNQGPALPNKRLQEALAKRERYLERHPHLRA